MRRSLWRLRPVQVAQKVDIVPDGRLLLLPDAAGDVISKQVQQLVLPFLRFRGLGGSGFVVLAEIDEIVCGGGGRLLLLLRRGLGRCGLSGAGACWLLLLLLGRVFVAVFPRWDGEATAWVLAGENGGDVEDLLSLVGGRLAIAGVLPLVQNRFDLVGRT